MTATAANAQTQRGVLGGDPPGRVALDPSVCGPESGGGSATGIAFAAVVDPS
jgi:hypothetical protein